MSAPERTPEVDIVERTAKLFHDTYERLAPLYRYETRKASAVAWEDVPDANRSLMIETVATVMAALRAQGEREPVAWRIDYECGHSYLTDSFAFIRSYQGGGCQTRGCNGEYKRHTPLYAHPQDTDTATRE
jgi:hypothetical protein